jgi:hypothetical protein
VKNQPWNNACQAKTVSRICSHLILAQIWVQFRTLLLPGHNRLDGSPHLTGLPNQEGKQQ